MAIVTLDQYNQQQGTGVDYDAVFQNYNNPDQAQGQEQGGTNWGMYAAEDGSVLDAITSKWDMAKANFLKENVGSDNSDFAAANFKRKREEAIAARDKLGVAGQAVAGAVNLLPIAAASAINPLFGAGTAATMYTGDALTEQMMETGETNFGKALAAGLATGAADLATGGIAGRFRSALPAAAPIAKRIGINVAEDASAAMAGNAFTNMAVGRDWDEGMGMAAVMGAGAGGAVRGTLHGFSKARQSGVNKAGETAVKDVSGLKREAGITPSDNFVNEAFAYNNEAGRMKEEAMNARSPEERATNIDALVNMGAQKGGRAADLEAMKLAKQHNMDFLDTSFDIELPEGLSRTSGTYKLNEEIGVSQKEIQKAGETQAYARTSRFGREKARTEGLTKEADEAKFKENFDQAMGQIKGSYTQNVGILENAAYLAENQPNPDVAHVQEIRKAASDASQLAVLMDQYTGREKMDVGRNIEIVSKRYMKSLADLGLTNQMIGLDGKAGTMDPVIGIQTIDRLERMAKARMPNVHYGSPNKFRNAFLGTGTLGTAMDFGLLATGNIPLLLARRTAAETIDEVGAKLSQGRLRKVKEKTATRLAGVERAMETKKAQAMAEGDMELVAKVAEQQLANEGIDVPPVAQQESIVDASLAQSAEVSNPDVAAARSAPLTARQPRQLTQEEIMEVDALAQTNEAAAEQRLQELQSSPVPARDPRAREVIDQMDVEAQQIMNPEPEVIPEVRSAPVPAGAPTRRVTTPEVIQDVAPTVDPAMASRALAAQPEMTPESLRMQRQAELAAALQEEIQARQAAEPETVAVPEPTPEPAPADLAAQPTRSADQIKAEKAQAKADEQAAKAAEAQAKADAEAAKAAESVEAPEPTKAPGSASEGMKGKPRQPQADEPEVAPAAVEEPTAAPEKRISSTELVTRDLKRDKEEFANMSSVERQELQTDPARYKEMRRAADDLTETNTLIENMSSKHKMSKDVVASYINDMGGVRGVRKSIADSDINSTSHKYVDRQIIKMEREKTAAVKSKIADIKNKAKPVVKAAEVEVSAKDVAKSIADKHIAVRENLNSLGYDKDIIEAALKNTKATDTTVDFDPQIVKNWARTLSKQQLDDAKGAVAEATAKAKELNTRASEMAKRTMDETQRSRIESDLRDQITAHEGVLKKKGVTGPEKARSRDQLQKLQQSLDKVSTEQTKARADKEEADKAAKEASASLEQRHREFDELQTKNQKRMEDLKQSAKDLKRLNEQKGEIKDKMIEAGASKEEADNILADMFPYQDQSMNNAAFTRNRDKAVKQVKDKKEAEIEAAKASTKEEISKLDDAELEVAAKELTKLDSKVKDYSDPEVQSLNQLVADELEARGNTGEAAYMRAFTMILDKAERRRKAYPDNKDYWISQDDKETLQSLMNEKEGGSYLGNLQMQLASRFFGDTELRRKFIRLSEDEIQTRIDAGITDSDIVIKTKKLKDKAKKKKKDKK